MSDIKNPPDQNSRPVLASTSSFSLSISSDGHSSDSGPTVQVNMARVVNNDKVNNVKRPKKKLQTPQEAIDEFWSKFTTKAPGKATTVIPHNSYADRAAKHYIISQNTQASYDEAAAICRAKVDKIVKECKRVNQKYRDPHFDLESDLKWNRRNTLESLHNFRGEPPVSEFKPRSVKRVADIFENPQFYIDGPSANDVRQGRDASDCWLLAALCTLSNKPSLIERCCAAKDERVGVYGFVFHRDGEWFSEIIDDKLFLTKPDFDESFLERIIWEDRERVNSEEQYRKIYQSGSGALYFAQCQHVDETWLPLLEKAYAKAHGDYAAIEGGFTGEGIEDLTGGVTSELYTNDILDTEHFWTEELMKVNKDFLFGCSTGLWGVGWGERKGIVELHAYSVMRAVEIDGQRLVLLKNPWGKGEWRGPWSDGSKEWTAEWLTKLGHSFGDDGSFWISYKDLLRKYSTFDRTRLFGPDWKVTALWTTVSVPWTSDYHDTQFTFSISKEGPVVLVLSQLDGRYYRGLEGQYRFELNFRLHKTGQEDYVVRTIKPYGQSRSVNVELELDPGEYTVLLKINAVRFANKMPIEEVVRKHAPLRPDKLLAVGMSYDLAHSKGNVVETDAEKKARKEADERKKEEEKQALKKSIMDSKKRNHKYDVKDQQKRRQRRAKAKARKQIRKAAKVEQAKEEKVPGDKIKVDSKAGNAKPGEQPDSEAGVVKRVQIQTPPGDDDKKSFLSEDVGSSSEHGVPAPPLKSSQLTAGVLHGPSASTMSGKQLGVEPAGSSSKDAQTSAGGAGVQFPESAEMPIRDVRAHPPTVLTSQILGRHMTTDGKHSDGGAERHADKSPEKPQPAEDEDSDTDSATVSSVSSVSDQELEDQLEASKTRPPPTPAARPKPTAPEPEDEDEVEKDPWNAVATVGFRIYYKVSDKDSAEETIKLRVVRPNPYIKEAEDDKDGEGDDTKSGKEKAKDESEESGKKDEDQKEGEIEKGLDVDDSSKDATLVGDQERRKKSIAPSDS